MPHQPPPQWFISKVFFTTEAQSPTERMRPWRMAVFVFLPPVLRASVVKSTLEMHHSIRWRNVRRPPTVHVRGGASCDAGRAGALSGFFGSCRLHVYNMNAIQARLRRFCMRKAWLIIGSLGLILLWYTPADARANRFSQVFEENGEEWAVILSGFRNNTLELQVAAASNEDFASSKVEELRKECNEEDPSFCSHYRVHFYTNQPEGALGFTMPTLTWRSQDFPLARQLARPAVIVLRIEVNTLGEITAPVRVLYSEAPFLNEAFVEFVRNNLKITFEDPCSTGEPINWRKAILKITPAKSRSTNKQIDWKKEVLFISFKVSSAPPSRWSLVIGGYAL